MNKSPKLAKFLLKILSSREKDEAFLGDIEELFNDHTECQELGRSRHWYWWEIVKSIPKFFKDSICWRKTMFEIYLKITLRNMKRHNGYSFINIAGLAVGIACTIFIFLWVQDELSTHIPGPPFDGSMRDILDAEGFVHIHPGIHGVGDLDASMYDWRNPGVMVTIKFIQ